MRLIIPETKKTTDCVSNSIGQLNTTLRRLLTISTLFIQWPTLILLLIILDFIKNEYRDTLRYY